MTAAEITMAYFNHRGYYKIEDFDGSCTLILPYIMMDIAYQCYDNDIKDLPLTFTMNDVRKKLITAYNKFNKEIFIGLDTDLTCALTDKMDSFAKYMYGDLVKLQSKILRCFPRTIPQQDRQVLLSLMTINRIARFAQNIWMTYYRVGKNSKIPTENNNLRGVMTWSLKLSELYTRNRKDWNGLVPDEVFDDLYKGLDEFQEKCNKFTSFDKNTEN